MDDKYKKISIPHGERQGKRREKKKGTMTWLVTTQEDGKPLR